jgi:hypothetical protein
MRLWTTLVLAVFAAVMMMCPTALCLPPAAGNAGDPYPQSDDHRRDNTLDNQGGPDAFSYVFVDNVPPNNAPYGWIELRGDSAATWLGGLTDFTSITDGYSRQKLPLGFSFPFYGATYDCVRVATNGFLQFTTTETWLNNMCLPSSLVAGPMLAVLWDDLHLLRGGRTDTVVVGYKNFGDYFVIEFDQIGFFSTSCPNVPLKFEALLYPNGNIRLQYASIPIPTACANSQTIGIQEAGAAGSAALNYVCNTTGIQPASRRAILFFRPSGVPNPPGSLTATYNSTTGNVALAWQDPTQDTYGNPITIDSVQVWVGAVGSGTLLATVARGVQSYTEVSPPNGTRLYCVRAHCNPYYGVAASHSVVVGYLSYFNDFETDNGGWVADPPAGGWEWGAPAYSSGPSAYSGNKVWGTVLASTYANNACWTLTLSPGLGVQSSTATVEFWRWFRMEPSYDGCNFFVSVDNGNTWQLVLPTEGGYDGTTNDYPCNRLLPAWTSSSMLWTHVIIPMGQYVGQVPQFRFVFGTDESGVYAGFYFDDMEMWGLRPPSSIAGTVRAFVTNVPIAGARVWATDGPDTVITDSFGHYELHLDPGSYSVTVDHMHYCDTTFTDVVVVEGGTTTCNATLRRPQARITRTSIVLLTFPGVDVSDTFRISNNGGQCPLDFGIADTSDWLTTEPVSGRVDPNQSVLVTINVDAPQIVGDYSSTLMVSYNAVGTPSAVRVDLSVVAAAGERSVIPTEFACYQNYPNPFNASTEIRYDLPRAVRVQLKVFDILGHEVITLIDGMRPAGAQRVIWDSRSTSGVEAASGVYIYQIKAGSFVDSKKMVLIR